MLSFVGVRMKLGVSQDSRAANYPDSTTLLRAAC